jgi:hypothetical protein
MPRNRAARDGFYFARRWMVAEIPLVPGARLVESAAMKSAIPLFSLLCSCLPVISTSAELDEAGFWKIHERLAPPPDEGWRDLPWQVSVLEARSLAQSQKKPVYMLVRSGHPLGCV